MQKKNADKPEIYVKRQWVHAYPGIRVKLDCTVTAWPEAKVRLLFSKIVNGARTLINGSNNN